MTGKQYFFVALPLFSAITVFTTYLVAKLSVAKAYQNIESKISHIERSVSDIAQIISSLRKEYNLIQALLGVKVQQDGKFKSET